MICGEDSISNQPNIPNATVLRKLPNFVGLSFNYMVQPWAFLLKLLRMTKGRDSDHLSVSCGSLVSFAFQNIDADKKCYSQHGA